MTKILIEIDKIGEEQLRNSLLKTNGEITFIDTQRFDGELILQILATLNAVTIPLLGKIVIERIRSNKHVVIKKDGITISGLNADNAIKVLNELSKND